MVVYGFDTARTIRAVWASVSSRKRLCTLATTKSKRASTSSGKSSEPSARMSDSMPLKESMQNCGGRSGCCWKRLVIVGGPEARIAMAEGALERVVQHGGAHVQEGLYGHPVPAHLLRLVHALGHDRVDRALHERRRDRLTTPTPSSVMHQRCLIALMATWLHAVVLAVMYRDGFMFGCDHESRVTCKVLGLAVAHIPSHPGM